MTHSYLALKDADSPIKLEKGCQYLMSEKTVEELDVGKLVKEKFLKELTEDEALALYKKE